MSYMAIMPTIRDVTNIVHNLKTYNYHEIYLSVTSYPPPLSVDLVNTIVIVRFLIINKTNNYIIQEK